MILTDEEAAAYFAPVTHDDPEDEEPIDDPADENKQPEQPRDEPQPPQGNDPADTLTEPPAQEDEPTEGEDTPAVQDSTEDNTPDEQTDAPEDKAQEQEQPKDEQTAPEVTSQDTMPTQDTTQEPVREYIPPYTPIYTYRGSSPVVREDDPEPENKPQSVEPTAETPVIETLACGEAVIDTTRRVVLEGYGGNLHLDDPLTRAQMATIIYRLLDDQTIEQYSSAASKFADVPADAWYAPYVRIIGNAGIVNGTGGGNYAPEGLVTWQQIIVLLSRFVPAQDRALQYINCAEWAQDAMQTAVAYGWITDSAEFDAAAEISRGEFAELVNGVLEMVA